MNTRLFLFSLYANWSDPHTFRMTRDRLCFVVCIGQKCFPIPWFPCLILAAYHSLAEIFPLALLNAHGTCLYSAFFGSSQRFCRTYHRNTLVILAGNKKHAFSSSTYLRHLLDNLDDKPADERAPVKNKISFPYCFFILTHRASPVSGPLHRLAKELSAFWSAWYMHNATEADWPA